MDPRPPRRAADVFDEVVELAPEGRAARLDALCAGDAALRAEVESLLVALPSARDWFGAVPVRAAAGEWLAESGGLAPGATLGPYRLIEPIADGGMGAVWLGERTDDAYRQRVAIKFLRPGLGGAKMLERFRTERQVLADLQHPGIAHLVDGGTTPAGLPYLVMEYVDGEPIDRWCRERALPVEQRLALFLDVCDAVRYAHAHLVVHRDLKPGNIFVDRNGRVRLLDFGIAKVLAADPATAPQDHTITELRAFTPRYASPEQVRGEPVTTATDVYSLGLVLYELLTDRLPERAASARTATATPPTLADAVTRPSAVVDRARARRLAGDLDTIVLRALAWEPERRYATVETFAADVRRHLAGQPVLARPDTVGYRVSRFVRRNPDVAASVLAVVTTLAVALVVTSAEYRRAKRNADAAERQSYVSAIVAAEASILAGNLEGASQRLDAAPARLRGWEWRHLQARLDRSLASWTAHRGGITWLAPASNDGVVASASLDSSVALWDLRTGRELRRWSALPAGVESVALRDTAGPVVAGFSDGSVRVLPHAGGEPHVLLAAGSSWGNVAMSRDGRRLAAGLFSGDVHVWDLASEREIAHWRAHAMLAVVAFLPGGDRLVSGGDEGCVRIWDAASGRQLREIPGHARRIYHLELAPDGTHLVTGSMDHTARVWDLAAGTVQTVFRQHAGTVSAVAFDHDGAHVVSAAADHRMFVWDARTGEVLATPRGHRADVTALTASPDGTRLVTADWRGVIKEWRWGTQDVRRLALTQLSFVPEVRHVAFADSGSRVLCAGDTDQLGVWRTREPDSLAFVGVPWTTRVVLAPDGRALFAETSGDVAIVEAGGTRVTGSFHPHHVRITGLAFSPRGDRLVSAAGDSTVVLWSWPARERLASVRLAHGVPADVAFSPDGASLAVACSDDTVRVWDATLAGAARAFAGHTGAVHDVEWTPGGVRLLSASEDGSVRAWDVRGRRAAATLYRGAGALQAVAASPDGARIVAGGADGDVHVLDAADGQEIVALHAHTSRVLSLVFSPDGHWLASSSHDGTIRLWDE